MSMHPGFLSPCIRSQLFPKIIKKYYAFQLHKCHPRHPRCKGMSQTSVQAKDEPVLDEEEIKKLAQKKYPHNVESSC
jgi:hypothetical protein